MDYPKKAWHSKPVDQVLALLKADQQNGLSAEEVEARLQHFGNNRITTKKQQSSIVRFLRQFHQPLIYILLAATLITLLLQEYTDTIVIFGVVLINSIIGFVQETKALKAIDALSKSMSTSATVIRNGEQKQINSEDLVPGDVVVLQSGDKIPADLRLIRVRDLQ